MKPKNEFCEAHDMPLRKYEDDQWMCPDCVHEQESKWAEPLAEIVMDGVDPTDGDYDY